MKINAYLERIIKQIQILISNHELEYSTKPELIYLGREEFSELLRFRNQTCVGHSSQMKEFEGIKVIIVDEASHIDISCAKSNQGWLENCVANLSKVMQYKLDKNKDKYCPEMNPDGKGRDWSNCSNEWFIMRLRQEVNELEESLDGGDFENAKEECGDIANFAAFILDNLGD